MRKLLTSEPSTPVTNEDPMEYGKLVALGFLTLTFDVGCGASKDIWVIGSWSRTPSEVNLRQTSLKKMKKKFMIHIEITYDR